MTQRLKIAVLVISLCFPVSCAVGPTPERVGFNYPQAGLKFSPRVHVVSDTVRGAVASNQNSPLALIFPRTRCEIEGPNKRLLITGVQGLWPDDTMPLYDTVSRDLYSADVPYIFTLIEKRDVQVPWSGLVNKTGTLRSFSMAPNAGGDVEYTFTVTVEHFGNTIEFCWRETISNPLDDAKLEEFWHWTYGMKFSEPEPEPSE